MLDSNIITKPSPTWRSSQALAEDLLGPAEVEEQDALDRLTASYYSLAGEAGEQPRGW